MTRLTLATLSLEEGRQAELLPELVAQAGNVDLLFLQNAKGWHRDGQRLRYRAEHLLAGIGLDHSLLTADAHGAPHTLIFWRAGRLHPVAHYNPEGPDVPSEESGLAEFAVGEFAPVANAMSVHWATWTEDIRLQEAHKLAQLAAPEAVTVLAGDFGGLWPDCPGHSEFEPARHAVPPPVRHQGFAPGTRPDDELIADRRALTVLAEAGFRSAGCIAGVMTPTVNERPGTGPGGRVDHIVVSLPLAGCLIPGSYAVHVSEIGKRASDHRLVSASLDLDQIQKGVSISEDQAGR